MVTNDAGLISKLSLVYMLRNQVRQGRLFFHFSRMWITNLVTHRKIIWRDYVNVQARLIICCWHMR